ncbi:hypothetical protein [Kutzneria kofuensis]|uniref:Uncharacterized protein n=1 Tax=Kutzneria kofuensis TaxID=103725 RepID=A0A7W9KC13_9PSEU|nr:hypothetical protein [Kutzneria kofuensis]MBB5889752.1 hypothetical protein [Kutzneria kofuensis]
MGTSSASVARMPLYRPDPAALIVAGSVPVGNFAALWLLANANNRARS